MCDPPLCPSTLLSASPRATDTKSKQDPTDRLSYLCALLALVPQALCVAYATLLWSSREAEIALMFAGQMASEAGNLVLKRLIRQERPPGMPPSQRGSVHREPIY
jgi:hypothetical protein